MASPSSLASILDKPLHKFSLTPLIAALGVPGFGRPIPANLG